MLLVCTLLLFACASAILVAAAVSDWRSLTIPNTYPLALLGVFLLGMTLPSPWFGGVDAVSGLLAGALAFMLTLLLYALRAMGGGDTKLVAAAALLVGLPHLGLFLVLMAATGGVLALYALLTRRYTALLPQTAGGHSWLTQMQSEGGKVPYGVAIAAGGIATLADKWLLPLLG